MSELGDEWGQLNVNRTFDLNEETLGLKQQINKRDSLQTKIPRIKIDSGIVPNSSNQQLRTTKKQTAEEVKQAVRNNS